MQACNTSTKGRGQERWAGSQELGFPQPFQLNWELWVQKKTLSQENKAENDKIRQATIASDPLYGYIHTHAHTYKKLSSHLPSLFTNKHAETSFVFRSCFT